MCLAVLCVAIAAQEDRIRVETKYGAVDGQTFLLHTGNSVNAFLSIPFAKPPLGDLRYEECIYFHFFLCTHIYTVPNRTHSYTALSEIWNRIVGKKLLRTSRYHALFFLLMWSLQILLFGPLDSLVQRRSTECQLCEDSAHI